MFRHKLPTLKANLIERNQEIDTKTISLTLANEGYKKQKSERKIKEFYFSGTYIDERDAPIPGVPCRTGLFVIANSPR